MALFKQKHIDLSGLFLRLVNDHCGFFMAAPINGGSPRGNPLQHGPNESALLHQQGGVTDEHPGRGKS